MPFSPPGVFVVPIICPARDQDDYEESTPIMDKIRQPAFAAMMSDGHGGSSENIGYATAGMGGDRTEWVRSTFASPSAVRPLTRASGLTAPHLSAPL